MAADLYIIDGVLYVRHKILRLGPQGLCTMLDQGPPCFGHLAKSPFLVNVMVLAKLNFRDDLDKYKDLCVNFSQIPCLVHNISDG